MDSAPALPPAAAEPAGGGGGAPRPPGGRAHSAGQPLRPSGAGRAPGTAARQEFHR